MKSLSLRRSLSKALLEKDDLQDLLEEIHLLLKSNERFTYAAFARKAGFQSRSFARQLLLGEKPLNRSNIGPFCRALQLDSDETTIIEILWRIQQAPRTESDDRKLELSRRKLRKRLSARRVQVGTDLRVDHRWLLIYAVLGPDHVFQSVGEIAKKARFSEKVCAEILQNMNSAGLVEESKNGYRCPKQIVTLDAKDLAIAFKDLFVYLSRKQITDIDRSMKSENHLFYASSFSVQSYRLPRLTSELRTLLDNFMIESEDPRGEQIATMTVCLMPR